MTADDVKRLRKLEKTLGTLIVWLHRELGDDAVKKLLEMLNEDTL